MNAPSRVTRPARARRRASEPLAGHGCAVIEQVVARCACGWRSAAWSGKGAEGNALGQWWLHMIECRRKGGKL